LSKKLRIFVGSTRERLEVARAVERNLRGDFEIKIWDDNVKLSTFLLDALIAELTKSHYGIFVLTPDDFTQFRDRGAFVPRDNVLLEFGMFLGRLGRERVFAIAPKSEHKLRLPADLDGLVYGTYDADSSVRDLALGLRSACDQIREAIHHQEGSKRELPSTNVVRLFSDYTDTFSKLLGEATFARLYFIHSRRWRENNLSGINALLLRGGRLHIFLPDLNNHSLINSLQSHFDDGPGIPSFIADAYRYFGNLRNLYGTKVNIRLFKLHPTYTFYEFDDRVIVAMYPLTTLRQDVPALEIMKTSRVYSFFKSDIRMLRKASSSVSRKKLQSQIEKYTTLRD